METFAAPLRRGIQILLSPFPCRDAFFRCRNIARSRGPWKHGFVFFGDPDIQRIRCGINTTPSDFAIRPNIPDAAALQFSLHGSSLGHKIRNSEGHVPDGRLLAKFREWPDVHAIWRSETAELKRALSAVVPRHPHPKQVHIEIAAPGVIR